MTYRFFANFYKFNCLVEKVLLIFWTKSNADFLQVFPPKNLSLWQLVFLKINLVVKNRLAGNTKEKFDRCNRFTEKRNRLWNRLMIKRSQKHFTLAFKLLEPLNNGFQVCVCETYLFTFFFHPFFNLTSLTHLSPLIFATVFLEAVVCIIY